MPTQDLRFLALKCVSNCLESHWLHVADIMHHPDRLNTKDDMFIYHAETLICQSRLWICTLIAPVLASAAVLNASIASSSVYR